MIKFDITQRVSNDEKEIDQMTYATGILDVVEFLLSELKLLFIDESRYFGIVQSYMHSIDDAYLIIHDDTKAEDIKIYSRILYLLKPALRSEFKRLCRKRLSPADADICIIRKILSILENIQNYTYKRELKSIKKVIDKLHDNIKNKAKNDSMFFLADHIRKCMENSLLGKYPLNVFSFEDDETKQELKLDKEEKISLCESGILNKTLL